MKILERTSFECLPFNKSESIFKYDHYKKVNFNIFPAICMSMIILFLLKSNCLDLKKNRPIIIRITQLLLSTIISVLLLPFFFVIFAIFAIYRRVVEIILKEKFKSNYGGFLEGTDIMWALEDASKSIINIVMIVGSEQNGDEFYETIKKSVDENFFQNPDRLPKFLTIRQKAYGYFYLIKNGLSLAECVKPLKQIDHKDDLTEGELLDILSEYSNKSLPQDHTAIWEVLIGKQTVKWRKSQKTYPIVFRIHHSLGDGAYLLKILMEVFADSSVKFVGYENAKQAPEKINMSKSTASLVEEKIKGFLKTFYVIISAPIEIIKQALKTPDANVLHGPTLSGEKILVMKVEEKPYCIEVLKRVKSRFPATTFSDVLFTAVSASFRKYLEKHSQNIPDSLTMVVPSFPDISTTLSHVTPGRFQNISSNLGNKYSVAMLTLPLNTTKENDFKDTLEMVKKQTNILRKSNSYQINYWLLSTISAIFPELLLKPILVSPQSTITTSNLPGPRYMTVFGGCSLEDFVFWIPHRNETGLGLSILSYDQRLQMGLMVDKTLIRSEKDAQSLLDEIFNHFVLMDKETKD